MAHQPLLRSDSTPPDSSAGSQSSPDIEEPERSQLSNLAARLAGPIHGFEPAKLALDLVLNDIAEQARLATTASGAAIALVQGKELVCRAAAGASAPDLGVRLTTNSGLSGTCVQTLKPQRCDDAANDSRVDTEACRRLNIRSLLIVPLTEAEALIGVFAIFADRTHAFGEREVQTLQAFSRRILQSARIAAESEVAAAPPSPASPGHASESPATVPEIGAVLEERQAIVQYHDYWTDVLGGLIIVLTLLLGWMLGRAGWSRTLSGQKPAAAPSANQAAGNQSVASPPVPPPVAVPSPGTPAKAGGASSTQTGGMVVYEHGKAVFRITPEGTVSESPVPRSEPPASPASVQPDAPAQSPPAVIPAEVADALVIRRVEPQYPEEAKQARVQGDVVLRALIGKDGMVRELTPLSGDSRLAAAAMEAVRQWHFKPYSHAGQTAEVQTEITLKFTLP